MQYATAIGASAVVSTSNTIALGRTNGSDKVRIYGLGTAGATPLCRNSNNEISTCSSSLADSSDNAVLLDALKAQEAKNAEQQKQIERQQILIEGLRALACAQNPQAEICREQKK